MPMISDLWKAWGRRDRGGLMLAILSAATVACSLSLQAQADPARLPQGELRCRNCLDGHRFLPSATVADPFVSTHFSSFTGGGAATGLTMPVRNLQGAVVDSLEGDIAFFGLGFEYQYAVLRWLALRTTVSALGRVGTSAQSVVASGVSALYGFSLGGTARLWQNRSFSVSIGGDVQRNKEYDVDPFGFVRAVVEDGYTDTTRGALLTDVLLNRYGIGPRVAWSPSPWLGIIAALDFGAAEVPNDDGPEDYESVTGFGAQTSIDFRRMSQVPIGISLAYRGQSGPGRIASLGGAISTFEGGLFYTGRASFVIGVAGSWARVEVDEPDVPKLSSVQARLVTRIEF
jgi:hypothetical protein